MELNLQPMASACFVSGKPFAEGDRVVSLLVRAPTLEIRRRDVLAAHSGEFAPEGLVACSWVHLFKPRARGENPERELKLTAETLFLALADPATEPTPETVRLVQFLSLMLERKRLLRFRGRNGDGSRNRMEHLRSKRIYEVPSDELTPEFFVAVQQQLNVLVGEPRAKPEPEPAPPPVTAGSA
jgi:hypothetical protein